MNQSSDLQFRDVRTYLYGYGLALLLTAAAFATVYWQTSRTTAMTLVFLLAFVQMSVHFRFFLKVGFRKSVRDHMLLLIFAGVVIALMASGTLVLLFNLRSRMM